MPKQIKWTLNVQVVGGPKVAAGGTIDVEAHDQVDKVVPAEGTLLFQVQPGSLAEFLLITATSYEGLTYEVDGSGTSVTLDGAHVLIGSGAVNLLGITQNQFVFTNTSKEDVTVNILVGRNVTPPTP